MSIASWDSNASHTVDRDDIGHSEEGRKTSAKLSEKAGILALLGLQRVSVIMSNSYLEREIYMTRAFKTEVLAHDGARNGAIGVVNEAHLAKIRCRRKM